MSVERYKFTGKERDTETNYDFFGARYHDSDLGRWLTPDPLAINIRGGVRIIIVLIIHSSWLSRW